MYAAAARRFFGLLGLAGVVGVAGGLLLGAFIGAGFNRSISLGLYLVGAALVLGGFFVGNRGPVRLRDDGTTTPGPAGFFFFTSHKRRWATAEEREQQINDSAVFVALGLTLIILGIAADNRYELF
jgi:hypothetical protein